MRWLSIAVLMALCALPDRASADWLDEMPTVATVAQVIDREYNRAPDDQHAAATNMVMALILLRQIMRYQVSEESGMTAERRARMQALEDAYLLAELAIGRAPGSRRGALSVAQVHQFYESRRYQQCQTSDCYLYWIRFQLEYWNAIKFRQRILPLLFPCGSAPALLELSTRHAMNAPLIPFTPAAPLPGDAAQMARLRQLEVKPAVACLRDGVDIDGDRECTDWESKIRIGYGADTCTPFTLLQATTEDAASISVRYKTGPRLAGQPLRLTACRARIQTLTECAGPLSEPIGVETLIAADQLAPGQHEAKILEGHVLKPDPNMPYVIVVGDASGHSSATYFHKWLMGVVIHGYTFRHLIQASRDFKAPNDSIRKWYLENERVEPWQDEMVQSLETVSCYDGATFPFNWRFASTLELRTALPERAEELYNEIVRLATNMTHQHDGDVVDVHLIGHSRGTVIISAALKIWSEEPRPSVALKGSYVRVTLLDPHPANNAFSPQEDVEENSVLGGFFYATYRDIQNNIVDPAIGLPDGIGIREAQVWFQHSRVKDILEADRIRDPDIIVGRMALWGIGESTDHITANNKSGAEIDWYNLTNHPLEGGAVMDHQGVVQHYQSEIYRKARPGSCVLPPR